MKIANSRGNIIAKLGIGCLVCLCLGFGILLYAQEKTKSEFISTKPTMNAEKMKEMEALKMRAMAKAKEQVEPQRNWTGGNRGWGRQNSEEADFGENAAFYKTIIDYNIFRPLGWTPPKNEPSYSLVGTAVDSNGAISQATLLERRSNRYHFVTIGTKVGDMTVKDIQARRVTFDKAGETVTLRTGELQLLTAKRGSGGGNRDRGESGSEKADNNNKGQNQARAKEMEAEKRRQMERQKQAAVWRERMEKMKNASAEERREMIEQFRRSRGRRGRDR